MHLRGAPSVLPSPYANLMATPPPPWATTQAVLSASRFSSESQSQRQRRVSLHVQIMPQELRICQ